MIDRRQFLGLAGMAPLIAIPSGSRGLDARPAAGNQRLPSSGTQERRFPLPRPRTVSARDLTLVARPGTADFGRGRADVWTLNGSFPGPTLRIARGETARILLENELPEETILHWHGLNVPEVADGHPRFAIRPGETYRYEFDVRDRAGLYWYHPHTHGRTAPQTYKGMAGLLIVEDEEEEALQLPRDEYEIPLVLQDKRLGTAGSLEYEAAMGPDVMLGYLGDTAFANGVTDSFVEVTRSTYRLRILNASNARIFDLGLSTGDGMMLLGTDGGLLEEPVALDRIMMGTGERADLLVDFSRFSPGDRVILRSLPFQIPGMMGMGMGRGGPGMGRGRGMMGGLPQGAGMDLVEFVVTGGPRNEGGPLPSRLSRIQGPQVAADTRQREFRFSSMMMQHTINGRAFELDRIDQRVPRGRTEVWSIWNDSELPHPVHIHVGQFRVVSRTGGRNRLMPWERGLKDTVLVLPGERVDVAVRFDHYTGVFLLHCHNLEHEDMGMMTNFSVED